ncbi:MAG: hypothetical protein ACLFQA_05035 [Bacteroidales bacterium]
MKTLVINLDEFQKISKGWRIFNLLLGSLTVIISSITVISQILRGQSLGEYLVFIFTFIFGLNVLFHTFGIYQRISRRYVIIDEKEGVKYKLSYFYPPRKISWDNIRKVDIRILRIIFITEKGTSFKMKLGEIYYKDIRELKRILALICSKKGIEWTDTTHPYLH